ncbi:MAG: 50S ribosomal protein L28 [Chloroflexi bacterium]|nr:50S ribosomal protein L28 [Chloroflexota bacterium]
MAVCEICGKRPQVGNNVSFSQKKTKRQFLPNIQKTKVFRDGRLVSIQACAKCIKTLNKDVKLR